MGHVGYGTQWHARGCGSQPGSVTKSSTVLPIYTLPGPTIARDGVGQVSGFPVGVRRRPRPRLPSTVCNYFP